jgi:hypothetical protein
MSEVLLPGRKLNRLALRILPYLQANTTRLDISHNLLGTGGAVILVKGLAEVRKRYSSDTSRLWTLKEINMGANALGDESLESILGWAKKDLGMTKCLLQGNEIKVGYPLTEWLVTSDR